MCFAWRGICIEIVWTYFEVIFCAFWGKALVKEAAWNVRALLSKSSFTTIADTEGQKKHSFASLVAYRFLSFFIVALYMQYSSFFALCRLSLSFLIEVYIIWPWKVVVFVVSLIICHQNILLAQCFICRLSFYAADRLVWGLTLIVFIVSRLTLLVLGLLSFVVFLSSAWTWVACFHPLGIAAEGPRTLFLSEKSQQIYRSIDGRLILKKPCSNLSGTYFELISIKKNFLAYKKITSK